MILNNSCMCVTTGLMRPRISFDQSCTRCPARRGLQIRMWAEDLCRFLMWALLSPFPSFPGTCLVESTILAPSESSIRLLSNICFSVASMLPGLTLLSPRYSSKWILSLSYDYAYRSMLTSKPSPQCYRSRVVITHSFEVPASLIIQTVVLQLSSIFTFRFHCFYLFLLFWQLSIDFDVQVKKATNWIRFECLLITISFLV